MVGPAASAQVSEIGKFLDPLADRLVVASSVIGGLVAGVVPPWLGWPLLGREALIGAATLYMLATLRIKVPVRQLGKVATGLVFAAVPFYYMAHTDFLPVMWQWSGAVMGAARPRPVPDRLLAVRGRHAECGARAPRPTPRFGREIHHADARPSAARRHLPRGSTKDGIGRGAR